MSRSAMPQATIRGSGPAPRLDYALLIAVSVLLCLGIVMVASASMHKISDRPFHFLNRHLLAIVLGGTASLVMLKVSIKQLERFGPILYFVGLFLLLLVFIPGLGKEANGAVRWIAVGSLNFQSSEFMKLFMVIYIAGYLVRRQKEVAHSVWAFVKPMILVVIACGMILLEPDFGTTVILMVTVMGMLFLGGVPVWQFGILVVMTSIVIVLLILFEPYRMERVLVYLDPWSDPLGAGFQLIQALIAFGRGEWTGVGLGAGVQKLFYLPEAHTDFVMAVIGEELGLMGSLLVISLFGVVTWRAFAIGVAAEEANKRFSAFMAYGFGLWISLQAFINIGVNIGFLPTKGLTLPFLSYGSNSIIVACLITAILLRIDYETQRDNEEERPTWGVG